MKHSWEGLFQNCCIHYADCKACICSAGGTKKVLPSVFFGGGLMVERHSENFKKDK